MFSVTDILNLLEKIPAWKNLKHLPEKVNELEKRIDILENTQKPKGNECPSCRENTWKILKTEPHKKMGGVGIMNRLYKCESCGLEEAHMITPQ